MTTPCCCDGEERGRSEGNVGVLVARRVAGPGGLVVPQALRQRVVVLHVLRRGCVAVR